MNVGNLLDVHLVSAGLSVSLFIFRFWLGIGERPQAFARWMRVFAPVIDTVLY